MTDIIQRFFSPTAQSIREFYERPGVAYYVPLYQREYSWGKDNIDQLMEDIFQGVEMLLQDPETIRFMGTVILVKENNPEGNISPKETRALPPRIDNVIDGQQRISTVALLSCLLYSRLSEAAKDLPKDGWFNELREEVGIKQANLLDMFSFDLRLGKPKRKPIIIRGADDNWTVSGDESLNYKSDIASYIASAIRLIEEGKSSFRFSGSSLIGGNLALMDDWLDKVYYAHDSTKFNTKHQEKDDFPTAREILQSNTRLDTRSFDWPEMSSIVNNISIPVTKIESSVCSIVQLFAFCHFLLERCCFTTITPISEENAFDMFQSLNATGTPLTAIETFKPLVHHKAEDDGGYQGSLSKKYFDTVDELFENSSTFPEKTKLTNEFLNTLALVQNGNGLPNQFSKQRRWLKTQYDLCDTKSKREEFIRRMSDLANYWEQVIDFDPQISVSISGTEEVPESDRREAALCVLYLRDANHVRANTVLSRFYALMSRGKPGYDYEFVSACRAIGAFYTIWRAAYSNTGLDAVYERLLQSQMSWERGDVDVNSAYLKGYLLQELHKKNIDTKQNWMIRAKQELRYDLSQRVCKFALFVAAHDTVPDSITPGLMKAGLMNTYPYLDPIKWRSRDFKSIEHIAPQNPPIGSNWESEIYRSGDEQRVGNLTLLPVEINAKAGNKQWVQKWIYYRHLAETDPSLLGSLEREARKRGFQLDDRTQKILQKAGYNHHMLPIVNIGIDGSWNRQVVTLRTERICDMLWDKVYPWLT